ncbi:DHA2 family efflux MFS transporter permease subunit [Mucilaginibacter phyllosphaerae]
MSNLRRNFLIFIVILAAIMELIDTSIVNVALNYMSGNLGSTLEDTSWVITSYAIANVIIIPITSFLTTKLGRRNYYIGSIILFTFCSLMCGQAGNIWTLVFFRFIQGLGGGALLSVSQVIVFELFPKEKQGVASALFGVGVFVGPTIGPTLGGFITENYSWPWIFYINVPLGALAAISCFFLLSEPTVKQTIKRVDWTGIGLLAVGIGALQTVLERGETDDWFAANYIIWLTVTAMICLTFFVLWELKIKDPVVNLRVLKSKTLSVAAVLTFVTGLGLFTSVYLTPVVAQRLLGFTPSQTGLLLLPGAIIAIFGLIISARLLQKGLSPIIIIIVGFALFIYFNWRMSGLTLETSGGEITFTLIFRAVGLALLTVPLTALAVSSLADKDIPQGAALNNMMRQLGGSFGISIFNTYLARRIASHRVDLISHITLTDPQTVLRLQSYTSYFQNKGYSIFDAKIKALKLIDQVVIRQSTLLSYDNAFFLLGLIFVAALPLLLIAVGQAKRKGGPVIISDH